MPRSSDGGWGDALDVFKQHMFRSSDGGCMGEASDVFKQHTPRSSDGGWGFGGIF